MPLELILPQTQEERGQVLRVAEQLQELPGQVLAPLAA
jgi:hypothetical protein